MKVTIYTNTDYNMVLEGPSNEFDWKQDMVLCFYLDEGYIPIKEFKSAVEAVNNTNKGSIGVESQFSTISKPKDCCQYYAVRVSSLPTDHEKVQISLIGSNHGKKDQVNKEYVADTEDVLLALENLLGNYKPTPVPQANITY